MMLRSSVGIGHQVAQLCSRHMCRVTSIRGLTQLGSTHGHQIPVISTFHFPKSADNETSNKTDSLVTNLNALNLKDKSEVLFSHNDRKPQQYILPTVISNVWYKKTILDPSTSQTLYKLPALNTAVLEKLTPTAEKAPIEDPAPQGRPLVEKSAAWLIQIRKRKMKKHKLKKLRKRMIYYNRVLTEQKKRKKAAILQQQVQQYKKWGEEYDPEQVVRDDIAEAKKGGWKINIMDKRQPTQSS